MKTLGAFLLLLLPVAMVGCDPSGGLRTAPTPDAGPLTAYLSVGDAGLDGSVAWTWGHPGLRLHVEVDGPSDGSMVSVEVTGASIAQPDGGLSHTAQVLAAGPRNAIDLPLEVPNLDAEFSVSVRQGERTWARTMTVRAAAPTLSFCRPTGDGGCDDGRLPDAGQPSVDAPSVDAPSPPRNEAGQCAYGTDEISCPLGFGAAASADSYRAVSISVPSLPRTASGSHPLDIEFLGPIADAPGQPALPAPMAVPAVAADASPAVPQFVTRRFVAAGEGVGTVRTRIANGPWAGASVVVGRPAAMLRSIRLTGYRGLDVEADLSFCESLEGGESYSFVSTNGGAVPVGATVLYRQRADDCLPFSASTLVTRWRGAAGPAVFQLTQDSGARRVTRFAVDLSAWRVTGISLAAAASTNLPDGQRRVTLSVLGSRAGRQIPLRDTEVEVLRSDPRIVVAASNEAVRPAPADAGLDAVRVRTDDNGRLVILLPPAEAPSDASVGAPASDAALGDASRMDAPAPSDLGSPDVGAPGGARMRIVVLVPADPSLSATYPD